MRFYIKKGRRFPGKVQARSTKPPGKGPPKVSADVEGKIMGPMTSWTSRYLAFHLYVLSAPESIGYPPPSRPLHLASLSPERAYVQRTFIRYLPSSVRCNYKYRRGLYAQLEPERLSRPIGCTVRVRMDKSYRDCSVHRSRKGDEPWWHGSGGKVRFFDEPRAI